MWRKTRADAGRPTLHQSPFVVHLLPSHYLSTSTQAYTDALSTRPQPIEPAPFCPNCPPWPSCGGARGRSCPRAERSRPRSRSPRTRRSCASATRRRRPSTTRRCLPPCRRQRWVRTREITPHHGERGRRNNPDWFGFASFPSPPLSYPCSSFLPVEVRALRAVEDPRPAPRNRRICPSRRFSLPLLRLPH